VARHRSRRLDDDGGLADGSINRPLPVSFGPGGVLGAGSPDSAPQGTWAVGADSAWLNNAYFGRAAGQSPAGASNGNSPEHSGQGASRQRSGDGSGDTHEDTAERGPSRKHTGPSDEPATALTTDALAAHNAILPGPLPPGYLLVHGTSAARPLAVQRAQAAATTSAAAAVCGPLGRGALDRGGAPNPFLTPPQQQPPPAAGMPPRAPHNMTSSNSRGIVDHNPFLDPPPSQGMAASSAVHENPFLSPRAPSSDNPFLSPLAAPGTSSLEPRTPAPSWGAAPACPPTNPFLEPAAPPAAGGGMNDNPFLNLSPPAGPDAGGEEASTVGAVGLQSELRLQLLPLPQVVIPGGAGSQAASKRGDSDTFMLPPLPLANGAEHHIASLGSSRASSLRGTPRASTAGIATATAAGLNAAAMRSFALRVSDSGCEAAVLQRASSGGASPLGRTCGGGEGGHSPTHAASGGAGKRGFPATAGAPYATLHDLVRPTSSARTSTSGTAPGSPAAKAGPATARHRRSSGADGLPPAPIPAALAAASSGRATEQGTARMSSLCRMSLAQEGAESDVGGAPNPFR
jgi:hypothetical protein